MKRFLDRFLLGLPVLFIKQYPYAWIALIALWSWPPTIAVVFLLIVLLGILTLACRSAAWISNLRREHGFPGGKFHVDIPRVNIPQAARRVLILTAISAPIAWLLDGQFQMSFPKILLMIVGFTLSYQDTRFFEPTTIYALTDQGIGIYFVPGHKDYRIFLTFKEIRRIERRAFQKDAGWELLARSGEVEDGLLLIPRDPNGFSRRLGKLFIAPADVAAFMEQLPAGYGSTHSEPAAR